MSSGREERPYDWPHRALSEITDEQTLRLGNDCAPVLSCTKYRGLVLSDEYFRNRTIYSADLSNYKVVKRHWFAYATNHLAEGSIGLQVDYDTACISPIYTVFSCVGSVDPAFMLALLKSDPLLAAYQLHEQASVERRGAVRYRDFGKIRIRLPCIREQQRIAEILSTLDDVIEQTEALISKTQQSKAGLMHDLFTRGVTPDGKLRPPREEAPQLYKESPLGWIPKEWAILGLRECLSDSPTNGIYKPASQIGRGTLLVGQAAFTEQRSIDFSLARRAVVGTDELRRYELNEDNVLVSRVFATLDGVGQPTLVPALPEPAVFESNMMRLRVEQTTIRSRLLFEWLRGHRARRLITAGANASNQSSINQQVLNPLPIVIPPRSEQDHLLSVITANDDHMDVERDALSKLGSLKKGLMFDLLSGRVRVEVASEPSVQPSHPRRAS